MAIRRGIFRRGKGFPKLDLWLHFHMQGGSWQLPDEAEQISAELRACADEKKIGLIVTTGGTGLSPRDVTPEATLAVLDREIRAIPVAMWVEGLKATPRAMLSRAVAGTRGSSLILNLPGSEKAARENLSAVLGALEHAMHMLAAEGHG